MTVLDVKAMLLGTVSVGAVVMLTLAGVLLLRVLGFSELTLEARRGLEVPHVPA
jgi:hypothetical protein